MMTAEEAMDMAALRATDGKSKLKEHWLSADCPRCNREVALPAMTLRENGDQSEYVCSCGGVALVIGPSPGLTGYNLGPVVLSPAKQLWIRQPGLQAVVLPARKEV